MQFVACEAVQLLQSKTITVIQVVVISDPELANQILDRSRTPHQIDKPHERMFYHVVDEVTIFPATLSMPAL